MRAQSLDQEDALEEGTGSPLQSSRLENSMDREPGGPQSRGHKESDTTVEAWHTCTCIDFWGDVYWFSLIPHETGFRIRAECKSASSPLDTVVLGL